MLEEEDEGGGNVQGLAVLAKYVKNIKFCEKKPSDHCPYTGILILLAAEKIICICGVPHRSYQICITLACQTFNL